MTAAGRRRLDRAPDPPTVQLLIALRRLTREQLRRVTASLGTLLEAMELGDAPATMLFERGDAPARARGRRRVGRTTRAT